MRLALHKKKDPHIKQIEKQKESLKGSRAAQPRRDWLGTRTARQSHASHQAAKPFVNGQLFSVAA